MNKQIVLAFLLGTGAGGTVTAQLTPVAGVSFQEPAPTISKPLSTAAAERFAALVPEHFTEVNIIPLGRCVSTDGGTLCAPVTHATYSVPSTTGGRPYRKEHWSLTRSETVEDIEALTRGVVFPAALAKCPELADQSAFPKLDMAHAQWVGVEGKDAVALLRVPSLLEGLDAVECPVRTRAPPEALAVTWVMTAEHLIPAIRTETGLR